MISGALVNDRVFSRDMHVSREDLEAQRVKRIATVRARLALKGYRLDQAVTGAWIISKWNLSRQVSDVDAVEAFALTVGAPL